MALDNTSAQRGQDVMQKAENSNTEARVNKKTERRKQYSVIEILPCGMPEVREWRKSWESGDEESFETS